MISLISHLILASAFTCTPTVVPRSEESSTASVIKLVSGTCTNKPHTGNGFQIAIGLIFPINATLFIQNLVIHCLHTYDYSFYFQPLFNNYYNVSL